MERDSYLTMPNRRKTSQSARILLVDDREEERKLLSQAAQAFKERALAAANAFGFSGYKLSRIDVGGSGGFVPSPRMAALSAAASKDSASFANVPLEAGETTVSMSISGTIVLQ